MGNIHDNIMILWMNSNDFTARARPDVTGMMVFVGTHPFMTEPPSGGDGDSADGMGHHQLAEDLPKNRDGFTEKDEDQPLSKEVILAIW